MRKPIVFVAGLVALLIAAGAGWYIASPLWTLRQMGAAAKAHDAAALSAYVDYPALRESTKAQVRQQMDTALAGHTDDGIGVLGAVLGGAVADKIVDRLVTSEGVAAMFTADRTREQIKPAPDAAPNREPNPGTSGLDASNSAIFREGLDRFRVHLKGRGPVSDLDFERRGLGWKLVGIRIPDHPF